MARWSSTAGGAFTRHNGRMDSVRLEFERGYEVDRWRVIGNWVLAIPHLFILYVLQSVRSVLTFISFFAVLFTKQIPEGIFNFIVMVDRYQWRVTTYTLFMRNEYPKFEFDMVAADPHSDLATFEIVRQDEYNRWAPLYKWFLAIPHYVVLVVLGIGAVFVWIAAFFVVLFTGKWSEGMRSYMIRLSRYGARVFAYVGLLRDEYPAFGLQ
jgi:hypothetical protein